MSASNGLTAREEEENSMLFLWEEEAELTLTLCSYNGHVVWHRIAYYMLKMYFMEAAEEEEEEEKTKMK